MKRMLFVLLGLVLYSFFPPLSSRAQVQQEWAARYSGPGLHDDRALKIGADAAGNVYVAGYGFYTNAPAFNADYVIVKYSPNSNQLWAVRYNGAGNRDDYLTDAAVDPAGNVYVTGKSSTNADFTFATLKFNSAGVRQWTALYQGTNRFDNGATAIRVDGSGNVYVTGLSFPPYEIATIKYNPSGVPLWTARYDASQSNRHHSVFLDVDSAGNAYVAGVSVANEPGGDYLTIKYDPNGNQLWSRLYGRPFYTPDSPAAIAVDASGNVFVTGSAGTVKYDGSGNQLWTSTWPGVALALDAAGNAYTAGIVGEFGGDYVTTKYAPNGARLWWSHYREGDGLFGRRHVPRAIALDTMGNVYVTGYSSYTNTYSFFIDVDDYTTIKHDTNGSQVWIAHFNGTNNDGSAHRASALALDTSGSVYVAGTFASGGMGGWIDDFGTVKYIQTTSPGMPRIIIPPQHQSAIQGSDVTFTVQATGDAPLRYQWRTRNYDLQNETNATLVLASVQSYQEQDYSVVVRNSVGMTVSAEAHLTVLQPPSIYYQPRDGNALAGEQVSFYVAAFGTEPFYYQWKFNDQDIAGASSNLLVLSNVQPAQEGNYSVVVSNAYGTTISSNAFLNVEALRIDSQPRSITALAGSQQVIGVSVSGSGPFRYQWRRNGSPIAGNNSFIAFAPLEPAHRGVYSVIVSNNYGFAISSEAFVDVQPFRITRQPQSQTAQVNDCVAFSVAIESYSPTFYRWQFNGGDIPGATSATLTFDSIQFTNGGEYSVIVSNTYGTGLSAPAQLAVVQAPPLGPWTWRNPAPQGNGLNAVTYGAGHFVAVGEHGAIVTSSNGIDWQSWNVRAGSFGGVVFGNGQFIAVGAQETMFVSSNGVDWICRRPPQGPQSTNLSAIGFGNGVFVATGPAGVLASSNGVDWTKSSAPQRADRVAYGNGRFVLATTAGTYSSTNGFDWTFATGFRFSSLLFANGEFLGWQSQAFTQQVLYASSDGLAWSQQTVLHATSIRSFAYGDAVYLVLAGSGSSSPILRSSDTVNWSTALNSTTNEMRALGFGGGRFVAVGENGNILTSADGSVWQRASWATDTNIRGMAWNGWRFVGVGNDGMVWTSSDGRQWKTNWVGNLRNLRGVAYGSNHFVAVGSGGYVMTSEDGTRWVQRHQAAEPLSGIIYADGKFVAVGERGIITTSPDGFNWTRRPSATLEQFQGIGWGNNLFVASGRQGTIRTSPDGITWTARISGTASYLEAVAHGNGLYIASGEDGVVTVSSNGVDWTARYITSPSDNAVYPSWEAVAFGAGYFILGGDTGEILVSNNGLDWQRSFSRSENGLRNGIFARGTFFVFGNNETVIQSAPLLPVLEAVGFSGGAFEVRIDAPTGRDYILQRSSDLTSWSDLFSASGGTNYLDDSVVNVPQRFYRIVED